MNQKPQTNRFFAPAIIAAALLAAILSLFIPVAPTVTDAAKAHARTVSGVVLTVFFCGAAIWYWTGLSYFRTRLRVAYILLISGLIGFAIAMIQVPIFGLLDLWRTAWATGGGAVIIFIFSIIPMYLGMRQLARLAGVKGLGASVWFVTGVSIALGVGAAVTSPHFIRHNMVGAPGYIGAMWVAAGYLFFAGLMTYRAKQALGPSYSQALRAQTLAFMALAFSAANEATVVTFMPTTTTFYSVYGVYLWTFTIAGGLFLRAAYQFRLLTAAYAPVSAGAAAAPVSDRDYIDSIVNVANLASRRDDINPILDEMRQITAIHPDGSSFTAKDKAKLEQVYHHLEHYLTTSDPLRTFTREQVLDHVTPAFSRLQQQA